MHKLRIFTSFLLTLCLLFSLSACSSSTPDDVQQPEQSSDLTSETPSTTEEPPAPTESESTNPLLQAEFKIGDILNGFGTEKVGEYGYIEFLKSDMENITDEQLLEFGETKFDGSDLNYVLITFEDATCIYVGYGYSSQMEYGTFDAETTTFTPIGAITKLVETESGEIEISDSFIYEPYDN